jgi:hypothetical protein
MVKLICKWLKKFRNGIVPVSEYVRITSITSELEVVMKLQI